MSFNAIGAERPLFHELAVRARLVVRTCARAVRKELACRRTLAQLRALDDRALTDIGLSRSEIESVARAAGSDWTRYVG